MASGGPLRLGGVDIPHDQHLVGHSDADALLHALADALLGAVALGDIGELFPDSDPAHCGRDSADMLRQAFARVVAAGYRLANVDCIVFAEQPKLRDYKESIRRRMAEILKIDVGCVGLKAKTGEETGPIGRREALAAECVVLLAPTTGDRRQGGP